MEFKWTVGAQRYAHLSIDGETAAIVADRVQGFYDRLVLPGDKRINHFAKAGDAVFETACPWQTPGWSVFDPAGKMLRRGDEEGESAKKLIESIIEASEEWNMKVPVHAALMLPIGLSRKVLRLVEEDFGIYLDAPVSPSRSTHQQFGVYDEDEKHAGDIESNDRFFTEETLRFEISKLFAQT